MTGSSSPRRAAKSEERRRLLLDAAVRVIGRDGLGGLTHRAVAAEAGLPPAAATYHLGSVEDMMLAVLRDSNDLCTSQLEGVPAEASQIPGWLAPLIAEGARQGRWRASAEYQLYLVAESRPAFLWEAQRWTRALEAIAARCTSDPDARTAICALIDGLYLRALAGVPAVTEEQIRAALAAVVVRAG
jgi:TetR/AcrR family transcriptional regulator, regulator of biofilm formation and stress response